ncbi:right-handed parallel beta-helix repeat-containing protein [Chloroflexus sp.]|uniref:right-handed parallel beta-helix repeat-containing protein n=1 Tax=Chloroflexus sp. TaxID=1904827 RepID=UPI002ADE205E|nr:NosD domain-containing protein [Chloroflexus sp.]
MKLRHWWQTLVSLLCICWIIAVPVRAIAAPRTVGAADDNGVVHIIRVGVGGDYSQLTDALAAAPAGAIIEILPGIQIGQWVIDRPLTLRGRHGAVLDGGGSGTTLTITASNVHVQGLNFQRTGMQPVDVAILVHAYAVTIESNRFERFMRGITIGDGAGVNGDAAYTIVRNNTLVGWPDGTLPERSIGIAVLKASAVRIELNTILAVQTGIAIDDAPRGVIRGNVIRATETAFVTPLLAGSPSVLGATATFFSAALCLPAASDVVFEQNTLEHNTTAIKLASSARMTIRQNLLRAQHADALLIHNSTGLLITDNRFHQNPRAVTIGGSGTVDIRQNRFTDNETTFILTTGDAVITVHHNDFIHNQKLLMRDIQAPTVAWEGNYWKQHVVADWWFRLRAQWVSQDQQGRTVLPYAIDGVVDPSPSLIPYYPDAQATNQQLLFMVIAWIGISLIALYRIWRLKGVL